MTADNHQWVIMWGDSDGDPHVRLVTGTLDEANRALELMRDKYDGGEGFHNGRAVQDQHFHGIGYIEDEHAEYVRERDEVEDD